MKRVRKEVHGLDGLKFIAMFGQGSKIARQGRWIARDIENHLGAERGQVGFDAFRSNAGRVENDLGKCLPPPFELGNRLEHGGAQPVDVFETRILRVKFAVGDRGAIAFDGNDLFNPARQRQCKVTGAAVEFKNAILAVKIAGGDKLLDHLSICLGVHLSEDIGVDLKREIVLELDRDQSPAINFTASASRYDENADRAVCIDQPLASRLVTG